jgi:hypothetical protein
VIYDGPGDTILRPLNGINYGPLWTDRYPLKLVLHTTETVGLPGYNNGAHAPHITIDTLARKVWQHVLLDARCGALRGSTAVFNDTGVRTVMNEVAVQVEIIGYSDRNTVINFGGNRRWVGDFQDYDYEFIAEVVAYLKRVCGIGDGLHAMPAGQSWSYGINSRHRMAAPEPWESFAGMTAHGGVFGQRHWDTGVLDLPRIWQQVLEDEMDPAVRQFYEELHALITSSGGNSRSLMYVLDEYRARAKSLGVGGNEPQRVADGTLAPKDGGSHTHTATVELV